MPRTHLVFEEHTIASWKEGDGSLSEVRICKDQITISQKDYGEVYLTHEELEDIYKAAKDFYLKHKG